ncbi:MAG: DUF192 domain-containing protein [Anaerolineae bacterium]|nr:DUF192 domain-containing protein [Anaerolineae bacterium]
MTAYRQVTHVDTGEVLVPRARWCDSFGSKLRGFTLRRTLALDDGLVLVQSSESRINSAIHMLFVFFDLGVIWVDDAGAVVDTALARPWRLHYAPGAPARYVVEAHPDVLDQVRVGDLIRFD